MSAARGLGVVLDVDLDSAGDLSSLRAAARDHRIVYVLLRSHGRPIARQVLDRAIPRDAQDLAEDVRFASRVGTAATPPRPRDEPEAMAVADDVSVVIATRDRAAGLAETLASLQRLDPGPGEIVVVDSGSARPGESEAAARDAGAHFVACAALSAGLLWLAGVF